MVSLIKAEIDTKPNSSSAITGIVNIDDWSGRIGLDIIGKAGFGSDFNALSNPHTPLNTSYRDGFIPDKASPNFSEYQSISWQCPTAPGTFYLCNYIKEVC